MMKNKKEQAPKEGNAEKNRNYGEEEENNG